jgi:hypothetical protein
MLSIGFWAVKDITAGEAEKGLVMGDGEDMGAKASRFIFLGSAGAAVLGIAGETGEGLAGMGEEGIAGLAGWGEAIGEATGATGEGEDGITGEAGFCATGAAATGEASLNASAISTSGQPTERKLLFMDDSLSPKPSCCFT